MRHTVLEGVEEVKQVGYLNDENLLQRSSMFRLHEKMLRAVLRSQISFFDSTPTGRIMNRFSKDLDESE